MKSLFLLFAAAALALFLAFLGAANLGEFGQLLNLHLFLDLRLEHVLLPALLDLALAQLLRLLFDALLLLLRVLLQVLGLEALIFLPHVLALTPFLKALSIIKSLVASQKFLDFTGLKKCKVSSCLPLRQS